MNKIPLVVIVGPTATGKTKLAIELAKLINGEIVNADSMQIYKDMNIGTAKPSKNEIGMISHHLIDFLDINENFNVADYSKMAKNIISEIWKRKKIPILVGGTGLYIDSVIKNINLDVVPQDLELRNKLLEMASKFGNKYLLNKLYEVDKESAEKLHENDISRVVRALEINKITGKTVSQIYSKSKDNVLPYELFIIGLNYKDRQILYQKIDLRVDKMIEDGLVYEVEKLISKNWAKTAFQAIGYKELINYFNGQMTLDECILKIKQETRRYAKRQLTWFRKNKQVVWVNIDEYKEFQYIVYFCSKLLEYWMKKCYNIIIER